MRNGVRATLSILAVLLSAAPTFATVPQAISVQGVLRDNSGKLQTMKVNVQVSFYDAQMSGNLLLSEPLAKDVMASNGLFSLTIADASLATALAKSTTGQVWLDISVGNDTYPRQQITSSIFALSCSNADSLGGTAASSYLTINGNGGNLTNLNGANLQSGTVPAAALGPFWSAHTHGISVMQVGHKASPNLAPNGGPVTQCNPCPAGTLVVGGACYIANCPTTEANVFLKEAFNQLTTNQYCCTVVSNNGANGNCQVWVEATCLGASTAGPTD
jgi:hypothetical protein